MLDQNKLNMLTKLNKLTESLSDDSIDFPNQICSFLNDELSVPASIMLSFSNDQHYSILGYSGIVNLDFNKDSLRSELQKLTSGLHPNLCFEKVTFIKEYEHITFAELPSSTYGNVVILIISEKELSSQYVSAIPELLKLISHFICDWERGKTNSYNIGNIILRSLTELRTPVNTIIGFTSILSEDSISSSQAEYLETIKENAQKILLNLNDLLDFVKVDSGQTKLNNTKVSLDQFVKQIVEVFKNKYASKLSSLNAEIAGTGNFKYDIDDQKLRLAFNNILNYLILTIAKPDISILLNTGIQSGISIDIKISGTDMELNKLYKIFEPFTTSQTSEIKEFNSSDLSLTLAHEYIKLNNGTVKVVSSSTSSCEIRVSFGRPTEVMGSQLSPLPKPTNDNNSILVIEDDYATSKLLSNYLTKWGYIPTLINTAEQTMDLIEKNVYLAIIMDIALPNINGLELLKQINTHPNIKKTPVIVCSIETEQQKAFLMGAVEYFVKPINYNYLVEILTSYKLRKESNILCVDDDVPTLNLLKQAVETAGFNALAEHISANVMESIRDKSIDLAIIDLDMPHPNGFELIKMIKSDNKYQNLPIIIYTGKDNFSDDLKQIDGMFEELLSKKSTNLEDLSGIISSMINRYEEPTPADQISEAKEGVKILFAEDYKHSQIIVTRLLKKNNFNNVVVVENGEEALKLASKEKFDLILMDMQMPIMNGFEATEKIKKLPNYQNTPIIALTAFAMKGDREKCLEAGATDYIPKPIDSKEFLEKVKYYTSTV